LKNDCNYKKDSQSNLGYKNCYETNGMKENEAFKLLAGDNKFLVKEIEVYKII
jgi:hypothetical protein